MLDAKTRLLVLEDDRMVAKAIARMLGANNPVLVETVGDAKACCDSFEFDLILADQKLRGSTGIDLYDYLVSSESQMASRFVLMTGAAIPKKVPCPVLRKPFTIDEAERVIKPVIG